MKISMLLLTVLLSALAFSCSNTEEPAGRTPGIYITVTNATGKESIDSTMIYADSFISDTSSSNKDFCIAPNPFVYEAGVHFSLQKESRVKITVSETNGKIIETLANDIYPAGEHMIPFTPDTNGNWKNKAESFYIMNLEVDGNTQSILIYYNRDNMENGTKGISATVITDSTGKAYISWDKFPFATSGLRFPLTNDKGKVEFSFVMTGKIYLTPIKHGYSAPPQEVSYQKDKAIDLKFKMIKF
jgi:hypothetical protein